MSAMDADARHLSRIGLQQYLTQGAPATLKIDGPPDLYLVIEPAAQTLRLRVPQTGNTLPDVSSYRNLSADIVHWREAQWCQLSIGGSIILDGYPVLLAVADRMQKSGVEFSVATHEALDAFREILAAGRGLSEEAETGVFGELLLLRHLLKVLTPDIALDAWRGHTTEEHDFGLPDFDLEVKTTTGESRRHWINSLTQLRPTLDRPLFLLSLQLTAAGTGGRSLAELTAQIESQMPETLRGALRAKLTEAGWREEAASTYTRRFRLRAMPSFYEVAGNFPTLTAESLTAASVSNAIVQVRYMIDLTHVVASVRVPPLLTTFSEGAGA